MELKLRSVELQGAHEAGGAPGRASTPPTLVARVWGSPAPPGRTPYLVAPLELLRPHPQLYIFPVGDKKITDEGS